MASLATKSTPRTLPRLTAPATAPMLGRLARLLRRRRTQRPLRGALVAIGMVCLVHVIVAWAIYPDPMPRRDLRRKLAALTASTRPQLIIAGDSRAESGLMPDIVAERVGLATDRAINMGSPACDLPAVLAGFRAFADRFDDHPTVVVTVSFQSINDRASRRLIGDETLWSLGPIERVRLAGPRRALAGLFLPERELVYRHVVAPLLYDGSAGMAVSGQGYRGVAAHHVYPPEVLRGELARFDEEWFNQPVLDGMRWRLFCRSVQALRAQGAQVVLLDPPMHPDLVRGMVGTSMEAPDRTYHEQLAKYCGDENVPLLRYTADDLCADAACAADPTSSFVSLVHLNRTGALRMSARVGDDLARLTASGRLNLRADPPAADE